MNLPVRARLALSAALLSVLAVFGAAVPFVVESDLHERDLERRQVEAAVAAAAGALGQDGDLERLVSATRLDGVVWVDSLGIAARAAGDAVPMQLIRRCPMVVSSEKHFLLEAEVDGLTLLGACARLRAAPELRLIGFSRVDDHRQRSRHRQLLVLTLAFASLAAGVAVRSVRAGLEPLDRMAEGARALALGQHDVALPHLDDPDLRPLADALAQLAEAMQIREDDIQQRLELTRQLAAIVAHEVRNPLQSLTMLADVVAHEPDAEQRTTLLRRIQQELQLIEVVVQRLVDSGEALRLVRRPAPMAQLIQRATRLVAPQAREAGVTITVEAPPLPDLDVDAALLRRAVENLLRNAVSILDERGGGRVHVTLEGSTTEVRLHVDDDGPGVPEADQERIFEAGFSGRVGGTGLGLPLSRKVAEAHGGTLSVDASPLGGARFTLTLPLTREVEPS
ncbi:MAG: HAMP domain-containing histidine kinase [Alphaproteobacteria bacterium]|nr:HAMP domain-containing histidine kinase [Alphaproteobacteria bacterium]